MKKLVILIDADNTPAKQATTILEEIASYGNANVKRIYGDWSGTPQGWTKEIILKNGLTPVQQFAYTKGKDATDMQLIIDAMDMLYSKAFDGFCIVSSDSDFTPLAARIRQQDLTVYGIGRKTAPEAFKQACDKFVYLENLEPETTSITINKNTNHTDNKAPSPANIPRQPIKGELEQLLRRAINSCLDENTGWASISAIGSYLSQTQPDFDSRSYGYSKLSSMIKLLSGIHVDTTGSTMRCRKIPYREFIVLLQEAMNKFKDKNGTASLQTLEQDLSPRFDYHSYGFTDFENFLKTVYNLTIQDNRVTFPIKPS
ncbi:NYN domain-containing protein [Suttonella ornithocola]|uniref:NYN domain n=1 Tax=Suttonella ornithocola TaxID=279832 RepID=A0A380MUL9_9GAMM|nr:NYN domain-containing protein [Suttonella ornithocola]SUO95613.1 NYN domain [Suttonella ornithocola]